MTIDEAISHTMELANQEECFINYPHSDIVLGDLDIESRKHFVAEQKQIAEWLTELKEAKRLLKAAIEDLNATATEVYNGGVICECCKWESQIGKCSCPDDGGCDTDYQWRYADEALKLLNAKK